MPEPIGLYVHIPFCAKKCPYCDFYSLPYRKKTAERYLEALLSDVESYRGKKIFADTLYFGGGTPSLFSPEQIGLFIKRAQDVFSLEGEITLEANPNTVTSARLSGYRSAGVNRLSFGMQSANQRELTALGRSHTALQTKNAVWNAAKAGFQNISLDLMIGTPFQTSDTLKESIRFAASLPICHISAYLLTPEPGTPYWNSDILKQCADSDESAALYLEAVRLLNENGFLQYEISNFAKKGKESRHNLKYWHCREYLGFGPAAHSFFNGRRYDNPPSLSKYLREKGHSPHFSDESAGGIDEKLFLGLRLNEGISLALLSSVSETARAAFLKKAALFQTHKLAVLKNNRLSLTPNGFLVSNSLISDLLLCLEIKEPEKT